MQLPRNRIAALMLRLLSKTVPPRPHSNHLQNNFCFSDRIYN